MARGGAVLTRDQLLHQVWGYRDGSGPRTVGSHVRALRRKLGPDVIRTVHGVGYSVGDYDVRVTESSVDEVGDLARAFNGMAAELAEVDQQRRDLVAMVSHELRTPITAIQANLENLIDGVSEPEPELFNRMLSQTERLGRLVAQLLDLSRLESGAIALERLPVEAGVLVGLVVDEARLRHPDLILETRVVPSDLQFEADAERLHQVLANLVDNAARYSPVDSSVTLDVAESDGQVTFRVADQGPGIPSDQLERVFDRYHRLAAARSRGDGEGTGLGLTIARWITELHGGSIRAERVEPTGCRMVLVLPAEGRQ